MALPRVSEKFYRRVNEARVVDVLDGGKEHIQNPCENPQEQANGRTDGEVRLAAEQLPCLVLEGVEKLRVCGPSEASLREAPLCARCLRHLDADGLAAVKGAGEGDVELAPVCLCVKLVYLLDVRLLEDGLP